MSDSAEISLPGDVTDVDVLIVGAGFAGLRIRPLPSDPRAKGPALFVATAKRIDDSRIDEIDD